MGRKSLTGGGESPHAYFRVDEEVKRILKTVPNKAQFIRDAIKAYAKEHGDSSIQEPLMCPMNFSRQFKEEEEPDLNCNQEGCAWWSKYHTACAIQTLNEIPQKLFVLIKILEREK